MQPIKLAIISTHPVQYYAPVFRGLAQTKQVHPRVFYTWSQSSAGPVPDAGFGITIQWDLPLLDGYEHEFVANVAARPGSQHFFGIRTPSLVSRIAAWSADAVLVYGWNLAAHLGAMRALKGRIPVFFRGDSTLLDEQPPLRRLARRVALAAIYRNIDVAIAVGSNSRDYYRWCGVADSNIEIAPHSVDTARFAANDAEREADAQRFRSELGIPAESVVFAFAGKFIAKKDPLLLIDAFLAARPGPHLALFGSGELEAVLRARAAGHPRVHILPFQNQTRMPTAYRVGDVFVLPSRGPGETWGLTLNEAMACQRPIIASSKVGGARDLVIPGVTGWQFDAGDRAALTALFDAAASMPLQELRRLGAQARQHVDGWSTQECVRRTLEIVTRRTAGAALGHTFAAVR